LPKGGRGSQQGKKNQNPKVIHMSLSLHEDVKLKTTENAWKPHRLETDANKDEQQKETEVPTQDQALDNDLCDRLYPVFNLINKLNWIEIN
jgi:hypothetical protein